MHGEGVACRGRATLGVHVVGPRKGGARVGLEFNPGSGWKKAQIGGGHCMWCRESGERRCKWGARLGRLQPKKEREEGWKGEGGLAGKGSDLGWRESRPTRLYL
ncbi:hypothetical protein PVAP13_3NG106401 [Panicum virgatum]|uniref:Uncharacterized protein n=1 Tax=Panicum virgatum TaxID=38727 RepID=A0A8T0UD46_PANVG|nr:hypothetical protein PVAP13_3NG106401 [Panicum virgatum]